MQSRRLAKPSSNPYDLPMIPYAAVLTGDLIGSTKAGPEAVESAMAMISDAARRFTALCDTRFSRHRGDGWQIYCERGEFGFRLVVQIMARLASQPAALASRISLATGATAPPLGSLASASGPTFEHSGRGLDSMRRGERLAYWTLGTEQSQPPFGFPSALLQYLDWQASRWSPEQAEAVALAFAPKAEPLKDLAQSMGISRQALQARLRGAGQAPIAAALKAFETGIMPEPATGDRRDHG